jgi:hypothetical protein
LRADPTAPAQARTLPEIVAKLNDAIAGDRHTAVQESLKKLGVEPRSSTPEAFAGNHPHRPRQMVEGRQGSQHHARLKGLPAIRP